jgi:hypothetical protein
MTISKTFVVSNHSNHNLEWLKITHDYGFSPSNTIIYDRTPDDFPRKSRIDHLGKVIPSPNVGSNIYDIGRFIVDHYEDLPDMMIHVKGNLFQRGYTNKDRFIYALNANWFVPIDRGTHLHNRFPLVVNDNYFSLPVEWEERNVHTWTISNVKNLKVYPRIKTFKSFIKDIFVIKDSEIPTFISFAPAANYAVPKNCILKYSKNFYKKMMYYTDYASNPLESHWFERILQLAWQGCLEENFSYIVE